MIQKVLSRRLHLLLVALLLFKNSGFCSFSSKHIYRNGHIWIWLLIDLSLRNSFLIRICSIILTGSSLRAVCSSSSKSCMNSLITWKSTIHLCTSSCRSLELLQFFCSVVIIFFSNIMNSFICMRWKSTFFQTTQLDSILLAWVCLWLKQMIFIII